MNEGGRLRGQPGMAGREGREPGEGRQHGKADRCQGGGGYSKFGSLSPGGITKPPLVHRGIVGYPVIFSRKKRRLYRHDIILAAVPPPPQLPPSLHPLRARTGGPGRGGRVWAALLINATAFFLSRLSTLDSCYIFIRIYIYTSPLSFRSHLRTGRCRIGLGIYPVSSGHRMPEDDAAAAAA